MKPPIPRRRLLAIGGVLAALGALAGVLAAWSAASPRSKPVLATYRNSFVTFQYPSAWSTSVWKSSVLHFDPMVYLSTQSTRNPCRTTGTSTTCGWPVERLAHGGVVLRWENRGYPGTSVASFPGSPASIGGRSAKLSTQRPGSCGSLGADETISVAIARPMAGNWTAVDACLRGPNLAEGERQVRALLSSARFLAP